MPNPSNTEAHSHYAIKSRFESGDDTPRDYLERCIAVIEAREPEVGAFVRTNFSAARAAADASGVRWKAGTPLSSIDGIPMGIKDVMETADMGTEQGSPLFAGWKGGRDSAAVSALREAGAVILGKTVTTEFAGLPPAATRNPIDPERTPGGSSTGSAASVGAGMVPAALGSQVIGSILRPASFCGCFGYKASFGGINRGGVFDHFSQSSIGVLATSLEDAWCVTREITERCGGDAGYIGVVGPMHPPEARKPNRVAFLEMGGWEKASPVAKQAFNDAREHLAKFGVSMEDRTSSPHIDTVENAVADALKLSLTINAWESRWPFNTYARDIDRAGMSEIAQNRLKLAESLSQEDYRRLIAGRAQARRLYAGLAEEFDLCISLAAAGAAPKGLESTGDPAFAVPSSYLSAPAISLPLLEAEDGMPLGLQVMGFVDQDAALFAASREITAIFQG